jgi:hypothetical protein
MALNSGIFIKPRPQLVDVFDDDDARLYGNAEQCQDDVLPKPDISLEE